VPLPREPACCDVMEIYFAPSQIEQIKANPNLTDADHVVFETDPLRRKFAIIKSVFEANDFWRSYDAVMLADDDVTPVGCSFQEIFDLFMKTGCRIGQPALTQDSYFAWFLTLQNHNFVWRRTNHVDFMCLMMTRDAIAEYLGIMDVTVSGFGLDLYWGYKEWQRGTAHAVLDATPMRHSRPIGVGGAYKGIDPYKECEEFLSRYQVPRYTPLCLDGVFAREPTHEEIKMALALSGYDTPIMQNQQFVPYAFQELAAFMKNNEK